MNLGPQRGDSLSLARGIPCKYTMLRATIPRTERCISINSFSIICRTILR
jgi:hypothetical protein